MSVGRGSSGGPLQDMVSEQLSYSESMDGSGKRCPTCMHPAKAKKKFCETHNKAFDNIMRSATRPPPGVKVAKKAPKKNRAKKSTGGKRKKGLAGLVVRSSSSSTSESVPKTDEHRAFRLGRGSMIIFSVAGSLGTSRYGPAGLLINPHHTCPLALEELGLGSTKGLLGPPLAPILAQSGRCTLMNTCWYGPSAFVLVSFRTGRSHNRIDMLSRPQVYFDFRRQEESWESGSGEPGVAGLLCELPGSRGEDDEV